MVPNILDKIIVWCQEVDISLREFRMYSIKENLQNASETFSLISICYIQYYLPGPLLNGGVDRAKQFDSYLFLSVLFLHDMLLIQQRITVSQLKCYTISYIYKEKSDERCNNDQKQNTIFFFFKYNSEYLFAIL